MRKSIILFSLFLAFMPLTTQVFGAGLERVKFLHSLYDDGKDIGLNRPEGVACSDSLVIVADTGNNRLVKFTYQEKDVTPDPNFEPAVNAPIVVQMNSKGEIFVLDGRDRRILIFNPDGTEKGYLTPKGSPVAKKMIPRSFKIDQADNIHVLDVFTGLVLVLDSAGNYVKHIPFPEQFGFFSDLAVDKQGNIFLVDSVEAAVYSSAPEGDKFSVLSRNLKEYVNFPVNIAIDNQGIIVLVDKHGGSLALVGQDGSFLGHKFAYGWHESQFYYPAQICISPGGYIFVADRHNSRVQMFSGAD